MTQRSRWETLTRRSIFWPGDHGSWVFVASPLVIGLVAGESWQTSSLYLILAALCGFLLRQPVTVAVKAMSGRRPRQDLPAALVWVGLYSAIALLMMLGLHLRGYTYVLFLAVPGLLVFIWHLYLVSRREERRKVLVALLATSVLALVAPAGYWIGKGGPDVFGWLLWGLAWAQSAASVICVVLRLQQRALPSGTQQYRIRRSATLAVAGTTLNVAAVALLGVGEVAARWLFVAFLPQWAEALHSIARPATDWKPTRVGYRQLAISTLFTLLFVLAW